MDKDELLEEIESLTDQMNNCGNDYALFTQLCAARNDLLRQLNAWERENGINQVFDFELEPEVSQKSSFDSNNTSYGLNALPRNGLEQSVSQTFKHPVTPQGAKDESISFVKSLRELNVMMKHGWDEAEIERRCLKEGQPYTPPPSSPNPINPL